MYALFDERKRKQESWLNRQQPSKFQGAWTAADGVGAGRHELFRTHVNQEQYQEY